MFNRVIPQKCDLDKRFSKNVLEILVNHFPLQWFSKHSRTSKFRHVAQIIQSKKGQ